MYIEGITMITFPGFFDVRNAEPQNPVSCHTGLFENWNWGDPTAVEPTHRLPFQASCALFWPGKLGRKSQAAGEVHSLAATLHLPTCSTIPCFSFHHTIPSRPRIETKSHPPRRPGGLLGSAGCHVACCVACPTAAARLVACRCRVPLTCFNVSITSAGSPKHRAMCFPAYAVL